MTTERAIIDQQARRIQSLQCDLSRMTKRAKLYKAAVKELKAERDQALTRASAGVSHVCLGDRCMCRTGDCQSRSVCGLSGRVTQ